MDLLAKKIKEIEMPDDMRKRIVKKCNEEIRDMKRVESVDVTNNQKEIKDYKERIANRNMQKRTVEKTGRKENKFWKKQLQAAAALVLCVCITGVTALAATGKLEGYFKDITNWNGAIVGISYEQATEEIAVSIDETGEELNVFVTIKEPEKLPYKDSELFGIGSYRIEDMSGNVIISESSFGERTAFVSQMSIKIPLSDIPNGEYKLVIEQFVSEKKADQPLVIHGNWECEFVY